MQHENAHLRRITQRNAIAIAHLRAELQSLQDTLSDLVQSCHGDDRPNCPIINDLAR